MTISPCPHCNKEDFVFRNVRMYGWVQETFDLEGEVDSLDIDKARTSPSKTLRCCYCGEIRRDLVVVSEGYKEVIRIKGA